MKLILGTQSVGRKGVLKKAGYDFDVKTADIDEKIIRSENWEELPLLIARSKTEKLLADIKEPAILVTADTVVVCNGELREKPESIDQARDYIESYRIYPAQTNTGVVVTNTKNGKQAEGIDIATIYFKPLPDSVIDALLKDGKVMNAAGSFMSEHPLMEPYVDKIEGDPTSIIGLPLELMEKLIKEVA